MPTDVKRLQPRALFLAFNCTKAQLWVSESRWSYHQATGCRERLRTSSSLSANSPTGRRKRPECSPADISRDVTSIKKKKKKKWSFFRSKMQRYVNHLASISNKQCEITHKLITPAAFVPALQRAPTALRDQIIGRAGSQAACTGTQLHGSPTLRCQHRLVLTLQHHVCFFFSLGRK